MARTAHVTLHLAREFSRRTQAARGKPLLNALMPSKIANKILGSTMSPAINNTRLPVWHHLPVPASLRRKGLIYLCANAIRSLNASVFVVDGNNVAEAGGTSVALLPPDLRGRGPTSPLFEGHQASESLQYKAICSATPSAQPAATRCRPDTHGENPPVKQSAGFSQLFQSYCGSLFDGAQQ